MIAHCLEDDFSIFLDSTYYQSLTHQRQSREPGANHMWYLLNHNVGDVFAHRDPTRPEDKSYYVRAVDRFRDVIRSDDAKLFVMITRPEFDACGSFDALSAELKLRTSNSAFICIQLQNPTHEFGCRSTSLLKKDGDHVLYCFQPSSSEEGVGFEDPADGQVIMRLINQFDFDISRG